MTASSGIRAEVAIRSPSGCPVADISAETGAASQTVSRGMGPPEGGPVTEEFLLNADVAVDRDDVERVFSYGGRDVYRFERDRTIGCPCETIERHDCPVVDVRTRDGVLDVVFHAPDMDRLRAVIGDVREAFDGVEVRRLLRSTEGRNEQELVFVDAGSLTDRQREVLETAHEMGYFDHPKGANAGEVAEALGITTSTFTEHLSAAQSKLFAGILAE